MATPVDQKLLRQTKFPPEFTQKVDMNKVNVEVMKKWIARRLSEILGVEDDVVIELCFNLLESTRFPDIKSLQIQLTGFLDKDTPKFCKELWNLCISAQANAQGVPKELLEAKKQELMQEKADAAKAAQRMQQQKTDIHTREQNLDMIRTRERAERGRGRGGREPRSFESRKPRPSRSPPRFRPPPRTEKDSYVPGANHRRGPPRARSPSRSRSRSSPSRSRSPPRKQRRRDDSPEAASRSPPPRRRRQSHSPSKSRRDRPTRKRSRSASRSRSPPREGGNRYGRRGPLSHSNSPETQRTDRQADIVRPRPRDYRRLSRSPSIDRGRQPRRRRNSSSSRSSIHSSSDSGSSRGRSGEQTRRRSRRRYEARGRRRSSPSMSLSPEPKRRKRAASDASRSPVAVAEQDSRASAEQNAGAE